ncbi:hypothetical protein U9M48_038297 [Paspalum notatum var. saurae]|uniref:Uncharacterized protein n=1 Tax=Paspalum notatum var. saurae TaxID=547442 RepID=A0AAQ3UMZ3_PASNO
MAQIKYYNVYKYTMNTRVVSPGYATEHGSEEQEEGLEPPRAAIHVVAVEDEDAVLGGEPGVAEQEDDVVELAVDVADDDDGLAGARVDAHEVGLAVQDGGGGEDQALDERGREHGGELVRGESSVDASAATQSRVSAPPSGHSTTGGAGGGQGDTDGAGEGSAAAAAASGGDCDMAWARLDAVGVRRFPSLYLLRN